MNEPGLDELLQITKFDHIAIAVWRINDILPALHDSGWEGGDWISREPKHGRNLTQLTHPRYKVRLEVLEPVGKDSYLVPFLKKQKRRPKPVQHHITCYVKDLKGAEQVLLDRRFRLHYDRPGEFFIHPESAGTLIQFFPHHPWWRILVWRGRWWWYRFRRGVRRSRNRAPQPQTCHLSLAPCY